VQTITGIACNHFFDWNVVICGTAPTSLDAKVWMAIYGDGVNQASNTWSGLKEITTATAGSNVSFRSPALTLFLHWRLFFIEKYTGSLAYSRLQRATMNNSATFADELWSEPAAFDYTGDYGVSLAARSGRVWLVSANSVWSGVGLVDIDVSDDVVDASVELAEYDGRVRLVLCNDPNATSGGAGRYSTYGSGALATIQRGARLELAAGYRTSAGAEASLGPAYWVESIEQTTGPQPALVVHARDGWALLDRWRAGRQFTWTAGERNVFGIVQFICARAGLSHSIVESSNTYTNFEPAFTIHPGENGKTAVRRLLAMVPDEAVFTSGLCAARYPQPDDDSVYTYGAGHAIVHGRYRQPATGSNRVRAFGPALLNEGFDFAAVEAAGERIAQVFDLNLTSTALAADRAASDLRGVDIHDRDDAVTVFGVNCGQELYDVVTLNDAQAGLSNANRRVLGITWRHATGEGPAGRPRYDMTLRLGNP
jgi:hypothetical protein